MRPAPRHAVDSAGIYVAGCVKLLPTLMDNTRALFNIFGAFLAVTLDSEQKRRFAVLLQEHADALESQIMNISEAHGYGVAEEAEQLRHEHAAYLHVIDLAKRR